MGLDNEKLMYNGTGKVMSHQMDEIILSLQKSLYFTSFREWIWD
jgi:hypothetical protein